MINFLREIRVSRGDLDSTPSGFILMDLGRVHRVDPTRRGGRRNRELQSFEECVTLMNVNQRNCNTAINIMRGNGTYGAAVRPNSINSSFCRNCNLRGTGFAYNEETVNVYLMQI